MARVMGGVMHDFQMREADKTDDEQAQNGRHAERKNFGCGGAERTGSGANHGIRLSALHPRAVYNAECLLAGLLARGSGAFTRLPRSILPRISPVA